MSQTMDNQMENKQINFMGYRKPAMILSLLLIVISFAGLWIKGLNFGIDFTGGPWWNWPMRKPQMSMLFAVHW